MALCCNVCGSALTTRFAEVHDPQTLETFAIAECPTCKLGHTIPQPEDLNPYYGLAYYGGRHGRTATYCAKRRLRFVESVAGSSEGRRILDVGCGDGTFLLLARDKGWSVAGTELNPRFARAAGLDVHETIEQVRDLAPFDCITLWHSLEHMRDPHTMIVSLAKLLRPTGLIVIAVPNASGFQARTFGPHWFHLDVPRHLYHFSAHSLTHLLNVAGFTVVRRWNQEFEYDLLGWSQSALNMVMPSPNVFFRCLTKQPVGVGASQIGASYLLGAGLSALSLPFVPFGTLLRSGGTLVVCATSMSA